LAKTASVFTEVTQAVEDRGVEIEGLGFSALDALHLACAEAAKAHVFLTTDDALLARADRERSKLAVKVANPATWLLGRKADWNEQTHGSDH
jgi:hypothetical protein